jgi:hypothetical protein
VWTTTWQEYAPAVLAPALGWLAGSRARYLNSDHHQDADSTEFSLLWKSKAVLEDQEMGPGPFIWIDDELQDRVIMYRYTETELVRTSPTPHLMIGTKDHLGITPRQMDEIKAFIDQHS